MNDRARKDATYFKWSPTWVGAVALVLWIVAEHRKWLHTELWRDYSKLLLISIAIALLQVSDYLRHLLYLAPKNILEDTRESHALELQNTLNAHRLEQQEIERRHQLDRDNIRKELTSKVERLQAEIDRLQKQLEVPPEVQLLSDLVFQRLENLADSDVQLAGWIYAHPEGLELVSLRSEERQIKGKLPGVFEVVKRQPLDLLRVVEKYREPLRIAITKRAESRTAQQRAE